MNGETRFFNYGFANDARNERVTADSIFNLGSVGKLFATTTLAEGVKRGKLSLDDPVAKYVTELQRGGDVRRITLGELASHTSDCQTGRANMRGGIEADIRGRISSGFLIPGRRTPSMSLGNSICIQTAPWFCCGLPSNAVSTCRSPN
jgi:hypothetical protein